MADLTLDFIKKKTTIVDILCYYCEDVIHSDYIVIAFKDRITMRFCTTNGCWDRFVVGVAMVNATVTEHEEVKIN